MKTKLLLLLLLANFTLFSQTADLPSYVSTNGLLFYYPFNGNANDASGKNINANPQNLILTSDRFGNNNTAYSFNGTSSSIDAYLANYPQNNNSRTITGWFKADTPVKSSELDFCLVNYGTASDSFKINLYLKGYLDVYFGDQFFTSQKNYFNNQWTFFAMTFDDTTDIFSLYINNVLELTGKINSFPEGFSGICTIGANKSNNYFEGKLDDLGLWNRVLSTQEMTDLYNATSATSEYTIIPDVNFEKALIAKGIDSGTPDGKVLKSKIATVTDLFINHKSISSLSGIEDFTSLTTLFCDYNQLTEIDVSKNTALYSLSVGGNQISTLNVSKNTALNDLYFENTLITSIDLSKNTDLTYLDLTGNALTNLDVSKNTALTQLNCSSNQLTTLDISKNTALTSLLCHHNQLTNLDISKNILLKGLYCNSNQLTTLDVSKHPALVRIECDSNKLTTLDVSKNTLLGGLNCTSNLLTNLDISKNTKLDYLRCGSNQLKGLNLKNGNNANFTSMDNNLKNNPDLTCIQVDNVNYSTANWSVAKDKNASFSVLCDNLYTLIPDINFEKKLIALGIDSGNTDGKVLTNDISSVTKLELQYSSISDLTGIRDFKNLTSLDCSDNNLSSFDISRNTLLTDLNCSSNKLIKVDLLQNIRLKTLNLNGNLLTNLDVSNNKEITWLYCSQNQLTSLNVTKNVLLDDFYFSDNKIATIDLSQNPLLTSLYAQNSTLTKLDLSKNPALVVLYVADNQLTSLDLSKNTALVNLSVANNKLVELNLKNGKNTILKSTLNLKNNPNLTCIQVDDADYSNKVWFDAKDKTASYYISCNFTYTSIPDLNFERALIAQGIDSGALDGLVLTSNITSVKTLNVSSNNITNLTGIEGFTALENLYCSGNQLMSLNISSNKNLKHLDCQNNTIYNLDVSKNILLVNLYCQDNKLSSLSLSENKNLEKIYCSNNQIENLYPYTSLNLKEIKCNSNKMKVLEVPNNSLLKSLECSSNNLTKLDLTRNSALAGLICDSNKLLTLDISKNIALDSINCKNNKITNLDFSKNTALSKLDCSDNNLYILNLKNGTNTKLKNNALSFINNINLSCIAVDNVSYSNQNWSSLKDATAQFNALSCPELEYILIPDVNFEKKLISLGLDTGGPDGKILNASANSVTSLDVQFNSISDLTGIAGFTNLSILYCNNNLLTDLNISANANLTQLICSNNKLTDLKISENKKLTDLACNTNKITNFDISSNPNLVTVDCRINNLQTLNLKNSNYKNLRVWASENPNVTCIQVDDLTYANKTWGKDETATFSTNCETEYVLLPDTNFEQKLIDLGIDTDGLNGKITIGDVSAVTTLDLSNSNISNLTGIENFTALTYLDCSNNQITSLNLSQNVLLETLNVSSNKITSLDLSKNSKLTIVYVVSNPLEFLNLQNGNNKNIVIANQTGKTKANTLATTFLGLNKLACVKVDDAAFSNANWSKIKETTTVYSTTCSLGIIDSVFAKAIVHPNPTKGEIIIENVSLEKANVYNVLGQLVKSFSLNSGNTSNTINLSDLPRGVYYVYLINQDSASAKKIIVE